MKFIYHLFGSIFFIIWSLIGLALIMSGFALFQSKPWQNIAPMMSVLNSGGLNGFVTGGGATQISAMQDMMKKMGQFGTVKSFYDSLNPAEQVCLKKQMGEQNISAILANPQYKPTPDMILKGVQCLNSK